MKMKKKNWDWSVCKVPPRPEGIEDWALDQFDGSFALYYRRTGEKKGNENEYEIFCTHCLRFSYKTYYGMEAPRPYKTIGCHSGGYRDVRMTGTCPNCGFSGSYYMMGRKVRPIVTKKMFWLGQKWGDNGFLLTGMEGWLVMENPENHTDEVFCCQDFRLVPTRRLWITEDGYNCEYNHGNWQWMNTGGWGDWVRVENDQIWERIGGSNDNVYGDVYPETYEAIKGTCCAYSCLEDAESWLENFSYTTWDYMRLYAKDRKIEMLWKLDLQDVLLGKLRNYPCKTNWRGKNPQDYLQIYKSRIELVQKYGSIALDLYQAEKKSGEHWNDEIAEFFIMINLKEADITFFNRFMSSRQLKNRIEEYAKGMKNNLRDTATTYLDYLHMREENGYDMTNSIYIHPKDLIRAHNAMLLERDSRKADEKKRKALLKYTGIADRYKDAMKAYNWEAGCLFIRPAKDAAEIIDEGRLLHHCVGGDNYLAKHDKAETTILFLRYVDRPEVPYVTVEIEPNGKIHQWYGIHDSKPDRKRNDMWLTAYTEQLDVKKTEREAKKAKTIQNKEKAKGATA